VTGLSAIGKAVARATWLAFVFGLVEAALLFVRRAWLGTFVWAPGPLWWLTPAGTALLLLAPAVLLGIAAWRFPGRITPERQIFALSTLCSFGLLLMIPRIHVAALFVLAVGLGVGLARAATRGPRRVRALLSPRPRNALVALVAWALLGVGVTELRRPRTPGAPVSADRPSILLLVLDTVRARNMSLYGYPRPTTPNLSALADSSIVFDRAASTSSWTLPSHASMFTGRTAPALQADWDVPMRADSPTLAGTLGKAGYATAAFTANFLYADHEKGLGRGFQSYDDYRATWRQAVLSASLGQMVRVWAEAVTGGRGAGAVARRLWHARMPEERWSDRKSAADVNAEFLVWLDRRPDDRPFFAFLNYFDAHRPYDPPDSIGPRVAAWESVAPDYDAAIVSLDLEIRRLLDRLEARGRLSNTIVIVTSDHGELFGEHGLHGHGNSLYYPLLHVPLLIYRPGRVPAGRIAETVSLADLGATVLDLAGVPESFRGESLARHWGEAGGGTDRPTLAVVHHAENVPDAQPVSRGDVRSLIDGRWHYIREEDGHEELYDVVADPTEVSDLADRERWQDELAEMRAVLRRAFTPEEPRVAAGDGAPR